MNKILGNITVEQSVLTERNGGFYHVMKQLLHMANLVNMMERHVMRGADLIALYSTDAQDALWNDSLTFLHK